MKNFSVILGILLLTVVENLNAQVLEEIGETTTNRGIRGYECLTLTISVLTIIVATFTLRSQIKTQKNTAPLVSKKDQLEAFGNIAKQIVDNYIYFMVVRIHLSKYGKNKYVSSLNVVSRKIDVNEIHLELFYEDNSTNTVNILKGSNYSLMSELRFELSSYNDNLEVVAENLKDGNINDADKDILFTDYLLDKQIELLQKIVNVVNNRNSWNYNLLSEIAKYICLRGEIARCKDLAPDMRLNKEDLGEESLDIINKYMDTEKWADLLEGGNFNMSLSQEKIGCNEILQFLSLAILLHLKNNRKEFNIVLIPYK